MKMQASERSARTRRLLRAQRATSLVEVLVVLVVLLVGVFAVIRVFPAGFTFLRASESRTLATRLAHDSTEQEKNDAANLPNAISYSYYREDGDGHMERVQITDEDPDDLGILAGNPYFSDVNKFRYIQGEPVKIGMAVPQSISDTSQPGYITGFKHVLKLGPVYMDGDVGDPAWFPTTLHDEEVADGYLRVVSAPLIGREGEQAFPGTQYAGFLRTPLNYVIDYGQGDGNGPAILFTSATVDRTYVIECSVDDGDGDGAPDAATFEVFVPAGTTPTWVSSQSWTELNGSGHLGKPMIPGSDIVTRKFTRLPYDSTQTLANQTPWSTTDPYQYRLISSNINGAGGSASYSNLGVIVFNPLGGTYSEGGAGAQQPFRAYVDYAVLDWHIIHDDRDVPSVLADSAGAVPVRTTLKRLKSLSSVNPDNTLFDGIFPAVDPNANTDLLIVRLDTGNILNAATSGRPGVFENRATTDAGSDFWMSDDPKNGSYVTGTVYINTNNVPKGTPIRIFYKAEGEWASALSKGASLYRLAPGRNVDGSPNWGAADATAGVQYGDPNQFGYLGDGSVAPNLWFAGTELNKAVVATLEYIRGGQRVRTAPVQFSIDTAGPAQINANGDRRIPYSYVNVDRYMPGRDANSAWRVVGDTIKGVSIKARVIWKDGLDRNAPWRIQDLDTFQTQDTLR